MKKNGRIQKKVEAYSYVFKYLGIINEAEWKKLQSTKKITKD
ncbi:hypothetical protein NCCP28_16130 [Niallia sp. NCCP-28]|nr:hypothetical protein NCCP28_16130 [Niallia sp. NCCP-28]